ncbi:glycerate kinase [Kribbella solani]|uniref:glycerate kinase family protein n=1 Tax=Kribbella solani TaxID=236067 RepID=UPI0029B24CE1|nr:glycerate kinase [Kribbella solani]MDX3000114.1 glycerate kinase [Kribbella solani]
MRILIAPDKFAGTLTAVEAAAAIEEGWRRRDPEAEVLVAPMADGGPGFIDVLSAVVDGKLLSVTVRGPLGVDTPATILLAGETAYLETAQACGLHLVEPKERRPEEASTYGVGQLIAAAVDAGAKRIILGLGGSGTNDAGAGLLAALGATAATDSAIDPAIDPATDPAPAGAGGTAAHGQASAGTGSGSSRSPGAAAGGQVARLDGGAAGLAGLGAVDLQPARDRVAGIEFVAASDVENPMLGLRGATNVFGSQKGIPDERKPEVDGWLTRFAELAGRKTADQKGAGAAGGLGYALLLLGAERVSGIDLVAELTGLKQKAAQVDLVLSGEGAFDFQSRDGKVIAGVAKVANDAMRPCVVLAGKVLIGSREMRSMGVESAYALVDAVGEEQAFADPHGSLAVVAERVAKTWAR